MTRTVDSRSSTAHSSARTAPSLGVFWLVRLILLVLRQPGRALGTLLTLATSLLIITNALGDKQGAHPAPLFDSRSPQIPIHSPPKSEERVSAPTTETSTSNQRDQGLPGQTPIQMSAAAPIPSVDTVPGFDTVTVVTIQSLLSALKFYDGPVDGLMGRQTEAAIRDFESSAGLPLTGAPSEAMMRVLRDRAQQAAMPQMSQSSMSPPGMSRPSMSQPKPAGQGANAALGAQARAALEGPAPIPLRKPRADSDVRHLQQALVDTGYGPIDVDGVMGKQTSAAIRAFQKDKGMAVTGQLSDRVLAELIMSQKR